MKNIIGKKIRSAAAGAVGVSLLSCTQQLPNSFRLIQQNENFMAQSQINTKVDLLWVVDNSSSMNAEQDRLRKGFAGFAQKYLQPTWDIQVAVISTDTYLANAAFQDYLTTTVPGSVGLYSAYLAGLSWTFSNPLGNPGLLNTLTGTFDSGIKPNDLAPSWGLDYAKLLAGFHDGPLAGLCFEGMPWFFNDSANCQVRDNPSAYNGTSHCLNPTGAETADEMCVNTVQNNTVRSGKAIIKTMPSSPLSGAALTAWTNQLIDDFKVNASTGVDGMGSERGLGSVLQLIQDNESGGSASRFFRANSLRGIIFVTDEDDQTQTIASGTQVSPWDNYQCDQASLISMNGSANIVGPTRYFCCSGGGCTYGASGTSCPAKNIDGTSWTTSICPDSSKLMPVATVKAQLDSFFTTLDGGSSAPNYFIATITPLSIGSVTALQSLHDTDDAGASYPKNQAVDRGDRYLALGDLVGNGSLSLDINATDYSPLLTEIGDAIILQKSTFPLTRLPTGEEDMMITLSHADGSSSVIPSSKYVVSGKSVVITDSALVLSFVSTDTITVNYQPKFVNQ